MMLGEPGTASGASVVVDATTPQVGFPQLADEGEKKECTPEGEERRGRDASKAGSAPGGI